MPVSSPENKNLVADWYRSIQPVSIIDIGPGEGTYAKLLQPIKVERDPFWVAVEVWGPYVKRYGLGKLYDHVIVGDVRYVDPSIFDADLVIIGDVLEHMTKAQAAAVIRRIQKYASNLIVSVPVLHMYCNDITENPYEEHVEHWMHDEMVDLLAEHGMVVENVAGDVLSYCWWQGY